jgi:septum formation protein
MTTPDAPVVLGSRSPRRRELLTLLLGADRVLVRPPRDPNEPAFEELADLQQIRQQLRDVAWAKNTDVVAQLQTDGTLPSVAGILTADTVIVATTEQGTPIVLGQPPDSADWQQTVREWFERYYFGRTHLALSAVCLSTPDGRRAELVVSTEVQFAADAQQWLEWYLSTGEPIGKAGGYGLQGAGSLFVESIVGSPSNVIGLPLKETADLLQRCGIHLVSCE